MTARPFPANGSARAWRRAGASLLCLAALAPLPQTAQAQVIRIKTAPVADGDQFSFLPSANLGMANVSIALADTVLDPFVNPAKGSRVRRSAFFGSPTFFEVSRDAGGGVTLPVGGVLRSGRSWVGFALAAQELSPSREEVPIAVPDVAGGTFQTIDPGEQSHRNNYLFAMAGHLFERRRLSLAASVNWSGLNALDGVDLLYAGSQAVRQSGDEVDLRLGMLKEWRGGSTFEALAVHNRFARTHDVSYLDMFWDPGRRTLTGVPRLEYNADRTKTWGLHLEYERPLGVPGWRIGGLLTGNRMSHPSMPSDEITGIPRDEGRSHAYNVGLGISKSRGASTFGADLIFEPIWSRTWENADDALVAKSGAPIAVGERTVENRFRFANAIVRAGLGQDIELDGAASSLRIQLGLQLRSVQYWLDQWDRVEQSGRSRDAQWLEWTRSWGANLRFSEVEFRYQGRLTSGLGRPGLAQDNGNVFLEGDAPVRFAGPPFGVATVGPPLMGDVRVTTHQVSVAVPIR